MEEPQTLPEAAKHVRMPGVIPYFNPYEKEDILKRTRYPRLSKEAALKTNSIRQTRIIAKAALKFYNNKTEGVNYVLVDEDADTSTCFYLFKPVPSNYLHASFRAKMADDASDTSNLFFAEATIKKDGIGVHVLSCCIIDESDATKFTRGCVHCWGGIIHPPSDQYRYGKSMIVDGCWVNVDFNKISLKELNKLERSGGLSGWPDIDGFSECVKLEPPPAPPSGSAVCSGI
ncbi:hypothetical protein LINGRAHAP2_LOCUS25784 [Linum grandiflorum]